MLRQVDRKGELIAVKHSHTFTGATIGYQVHRILSEPVKVGETTRLIDRADTLTAARKLLERDPKAYHWYGGK